MSNEYFNPDGNPTQGGSLTSSQLRTEFTAIQSGFAKLPTLAGNASKPVIVAANESGLSVGNALGITLGTKQASTSGTSIDFTGIPSWAKRITVNFVGVSINGSDWIQIQIGDSGGIEASGYSGGNVALSGDGLSPATSIFAFLVALVGAAGVVHGTVVLNLQDASGFTWCSHGNLSDSATSFMNVSAGSKSLSAVLDRLRITTNSGTATFDAGSINISYEG